MASPHRIVAADSSARVPNIVRAALDLLERPAVVIEVPSAEAALAELQRGSVDVLVCAPALPDMSGADLAARVHQAVPALPVIILAGKGDPEPEARPGAPLFYLARAQQGDQFVRVLRAALDGEALIPSADRAAPAQPTLGPVPQVDTDAMYDILSAMLTDVGAMAVVLADRNGSVLLERGAVGYLDRELLAGTLAPAFANMVSVGPLVGGAKPRAMHFYDGDEFDIFALAVGLHHFICLIFEGSAGSRAFGAVTMFGRRAVQEMLEVIGEAAFTIQVVEEEEAPAEAPAGRPIPKKKKTQELRPLEAQPAQPEYVPPRPPPLEPLPEDADLESLLADLDKLDLSKAEEIFDPEKLAEMAAESMAGERLSYEEAQQMGVLES